MTELTTKEIRAQLQRSNLTATLYQDLIRAIAVRRRTVKERLSSIEDRNGAARRAAFESADSEVLAKLNQEAESLDDELGFLADLDTRAFKLHAAAHDREAIEAGQRGHRRIASLIKAAGDALTAYEAARQQLADAAAAISGVNDMKLGERLTVDDAAVDRIMAVLWPPSLVREEHRRGALVTLRRQVCAPDKPKYAEPMPDLREQRHANIFGRRDS